MTMFEDQVSSAQDAKPSSLLRRASDLLTASPIAVLVTFALYFALQTVLRPLLPPALRIDEAQQILFNQWHALGYDAQPPLYNWYQQAIFAILGPTIMALSVAKNLILFLIFAAYVATARLVVGDRRLIAIAAFTLFTIPQVFWQAQRDLTHTSMLMLCVVALLWTTIRLIQKPTLSGYVLAGIVTGLSLLSKYNAAIILPAVLYAVWRHPQGRDRILDRRFLLTMAIGALMFLPHAGWLLANFELASEITIERMAENAPANRLLQIAAGLGDFLTGSMIILIVPVILIALCMYGGRTTVPGKDDHDSRIWYRFFVDYFVGLLLLMLLMITVLTFTEVRDRWLLPMLIPFPLLACLWLEQKRVDLSHFIPRFMIGPCLLLIIIPIAVVVSSPLLAALGERSRSNYDWTSFRQYIESVEKIVPSGIVTSNWSTGGNLLFVYKDVPVVTTTYSDFTPHFQITNERPLLLVQVSGLDDYAEMTEWLSQNYQLDITRLRIETVEIPMYFETANEAVRFNYTLIRPDDIRQPK